jgi:hypothetical protein
MQPKAWTRRVNAETMEFLTKDLPLDDAEGTTAELLTRLYEVGWRGPQVAPAIDPRGTKVLWPAEDSEGIPVLTSEGLAQWWEERGHEWVLLRAGTLARAMAGPLAPLLQEVLAAYEEQCEATGVIPMPPWADWRVFVGGEKPVIDAKLLHDNLSKGGQEG